VAELQDSFQAALLAAVGAAGVWGPGKAPGAADRLELRLMGDASFD